MTSLDTSKFGADWQYYVSAVGLLRAGYWEQQLPPASLPLLREHLSSFDRWRRFFNLEQLDVSESRRSERTSDTRSSSKSRKQRGTTSKSRGSDGGGGRHDQDARSSKSAIVKEEKEEGEADYQSSDDVVPPPSELTDFIENDRSLAEERKELLGDDGLLSMRVRVLLFDVLMQNALHLKEPSIQLGKQSSMDVIGPYSGHASAGGGATGIVYSVTQATDEAEPQGDLVMTEAPMKQEEETEEMETEEEIHEAKVARLEQAPALDFSTPDALASTAEPLLRHGMRRYYRLEDMFYTLEYDAEDLAFEQERHQGIARGILPDIPLPSHDESLEDDPAESTAEEALDGSVNQVPTPVEQSAESSVLSTSPTQSHQRTGAENNLIAAVASAENSGSGQEPKQGTRFMQGPSLAESTEALPTSARDSASPDRSPGSTNGSPRGASSSRELRNLLSDVKPHKPWSGSPIDGQEELCAALESVMVALKNYTKHSYPFLTRVRKCDAPDYYDVIKDPMDLGKMHKKLKRLDYFSKQEFIDDLDLMFDNCRRYNTDPKSIYRVHAKMLDKKAKGLLKKVPDIDISADRVVLEEAMKSRRGRPRSHTPGSAPGGASRSRGRPGRPRKHSADMGEDESPSPVISPMASAKRGRPGRPRKFFLDDESPSRSQSPSTAKRKRGRPGRPRKLRPEDYYEPEYLLAQMLQITEPDDYTTEELVREYFEGLDEEQRLEFQKEDPQVRLWRVRTLAGRLRAAREREICKELPFGEHRELRRTPKAMFQFVCNYASHCDELPVLEGSGHYDDEALCSSEAYADTEEAKFMEKRPSFSTSNLPQVIDITIESTKKKRGRGRISNVERQKIQEEEEIKRAMAMRAPLDKSTCENYFMPEGLPLCAVPDMPQPLPLVSPHPDPYPFSSELRSQMTANLASVRAIHKLTAEPEPQHLDTQRASTPAPTATETSHRELPDVSPASLADRSFLSHRNPEACRVMLTKAVAAAVEHAGFDAAETSALEVLSDGCSRFFEKFACALQAHQVVFCNNTKPEALLTRCLFEMGVDGVQDLRRHMENDVDLRGKRLQQVVQLAAQTSKLPPDQVAKLSCPSQHLVEKAEPSGLGDCPPILCRDVLVPADCQVPPLPRAFEEMLEAGRRLREEVQQPTDDDGDAKMADADEEAGSAEKEEEEEEAKDEEEEGEGDDEEEEEEEDEAEDQPRRKSTRSSRSSALGKRTRPEPRSTRATRSRQDPSPKTSKTRSSGAVSPPQRRRSRSSRTRNP